MACDRDSLAGAVSQRACVFCGSRVVLYPIADALHLVHGPIGCAAYTWDIRGALSSGPELHRLSFSTDLQELDVVFGGEKKLAKALDELKQSIAADSNYAQAYSLRGLIYMRLNDFRLSEESFKRALNLSPRDSNFMHNLGWLYCQQTRYAQAQQLFSQALENPQYAERAKTWRAQGLCQVRAGQLSEGEQSLFKSYEFDAGNPVTAYNLAALLFQRGDQARAQFYVRRLNNSELANAESLWLGVKVERRMENRDAMLQLAAQLLKRFPKSREADSYQRGAFDE